MTLEDIMKPNKFGTVPSIHFVSVGMGKLVGEYVYVTIVNSITEYVPLTTEIIMSGDTVTLMHPVLAGYTSKLVYWVPLTADQILIHNAIQPLNRVIVTTDNYTTTLKATDEVLSGLLDDGTGWVNLGYGTEPASFYVEDILYRLDLQGKLT